MSQNHFHTISLAPECARKGGGEYVEKEERRRRRLNVAVEDITESSTLIVSRRHPKKKTTTVTEQKMRVDDSLVHFPSCNICFPPTDALLTGWWW